MPYPYAAGSHQSKNEQYVTLLCVTWLDEYVLLRTKLAKAVKVDLAHISRIFSGKRSPSLDLARRIADYMGVSLDKLQAFLDGRQP